MVEFLENSLVTLPVSVTGSRIFVGEIFHLEETIAADILPGFTKIALESRPLYLVQN